LGVIHSEEAFEEKKKKNFASPIERAQVLDMKNEGPSNGAPK